MATSPPLRKKQPDLRDLASLGRAYADFTSAGNSDLRVAKEFFNVIAEPFFRIPLYQVYRTYYAIRIQLADMLCSSRSAFQDST